MIKKLIVLFALVTLFASVANAQWTDMGAFPDTNYTGSTHGIAVDPDGKIWTAPYYYETLWPENDSIFTAGIRVFLPTGEEASFSPIHTVATGGGFVVDTLYPGRCRGLTADENGNIVYVASGPSKMFKINYLTGEGMAAVEIPETGSSPTQPGIADDGTIFVGPVVGGGTNQIAMYDTDLAYIGSAVDAPPSISRCLEVTGDGNTIYWTPFTGTAMFIYKRADEFSSFELVDSALADMSIETVRLNPATGLLWVSSDSRKTTYSSTTWFAYDPATKALVDSFAYTPKDPEASDILPRGLDFSPDGMTAYVGTFSALNYGITKYVFGAAPTVDLTLQVDMSVQIDKGNFTVGTDVVRCAGAFQGWAPENAPDMDDTDGDKIYTVTYAVDPSTTYEYKFVIGTNWDNAEASNRSVDVGTTAMTVDPVYFDNDEGVETTEIAVSFQCNMELEIAAARFDPASDTLTARGSFNGWSDATMLAPSVEDPNIYEGSGQYDSFDGDVIFYKFAYTHGGGTNWENNPPTGSGNYEEAVSGDDITNGYVLVPLRGYNNATLETVVNQESVIRFVVDMNGAVDGNGISLEPVSNTFIAGANPPLQWPDGGWPDGDSTKVIFMADDGTNGDETAGDNFWTMEVTFPIYSPLDIEYKYGANWGLPSNGGANDNEGGVGTNHHATIFPSFWSGDAVDDFGTFDTKDVVNGVEQVDSGVPSKYELSQNYPNPFNPSTIINFSIPQSGIVTLRVYNVLGQEVAELVNDVKSAGTYEVSFDASNLTTGMYVYTIQAGNYSATKKMLLVK